ncbi:DUF2631 domain-containing protein [Mycolicibacterium moriokaense]|nr:DUF2631 domain-containing protein [Mycolicibacterium moriokaense]
MVSTELDKTNGVDVEDVPSAEWGWSKENHRAIQIGGILSALFMLAMLRGNHVGKVEDIFLICFAVAILGVVARDWWLRRRGWTR